MSEKRSPAAAEPESDRMIIIPRVVNASRELVWKAWSEPAHVVNWWGPVGFRTTIEKMDFRPGGVWRHIMHGPDGTEYPNQSTFIEIQKPERIVYQHGGARRDGPAVSFVSTWTFEKAEGGKTRVTIRHVFPSVEMRDLVVREYGAEEGGKQTLGRLDEYTARMGDDRAAPEAFSLRLTRLLNSPRERVWAAFTREEHLREWWGPEGFTNPVCRVQLQLGGELYIDMRAPDGTIYPMSGKYREIDPPKRLVFVSSALDEKGKSLFEVEHTVTFDAEGAGKTRLTWQTRVAEVPPGAAAYLSGMEQGIGQSLEKLEHVL